MLYIYKCYEKLLQSEKFFYSVKKNRVVRSENIGTYKIYKMSVKTFIFKRSCGYFP